MNPSVLMLDRTGGAYHTSSLASHGLGGSELELLQVAKWLTAKGHSVVVANGVDQIFTEDGITFVPHAQAWQHRPTKALYLQRYSTPETRLEIGPDVRIVVRANDVYCPPYDVHRGLLESGRAALVANTHWQADQFGFAKERAIIPPMLEPMPHPKKQRGLFIFASGAMKGFEATVALWCAMKERHPAMRAAKLLIVVPGWGEPRALTDQEKAAGICGIGNPDPATYRRWIAKAEGLFTVLTMPETFGCAMALAERAGTRTHILCTAGLGGLTESLRDHSYVTDDPGVFEQRFLYALGTLREPETDLPDLSPSTMIDRWADVLHVNGSTPVTVSPFPDDPTLVKNQEPLGPFFGDFLSLLRSSIAPGGSEFGAGLMLFSLATSIRAKHIVEIGRFKGFSTLALAAACRLQHIGWTEPKAAEQRPDVQYHEAPQEPWFYHNGMTATPDWIMANTPIAKIVPAADDQWKKPVSWPSSQHVVSIDPSPQPEAMDLLVRANLQNYVDFRNETSASIPLWWFQKPIDLLFIDGDHSVVGLRADIEKFVPLVRPGGYFILHDYFGWFTPDGQNGSPIAQVIAEDLTTCDRVLIDTGYASLVVFRKAKHLTERWELEPKPSKIPARADGRPTVGLCLIAKGDEASTVATRAIVSAKKAGVDCCTIVCDANDATAEVARSLGANVFIRPSPAIDWERGIGVIAGARNEALAIAERRTDYILMLDADDHFDGTLPSRFDHDAYEVTIHDGGLAYQRVQLFRAALGWRYAGIVHETLTMTGAGPMGRLEGLRYLRGKSAYGYQDQDPPAVKFAKHAHLLEKWLLDHHDDPRAQFYLARSYQDAGRPEQAIAAYETRIAMLNGWEEERSYSAYQIGHLRAGLGQDPTTAWLQAYGIGSKKAEPLVALARWYRDDARKQFSTAYLFARRAAEIPPPNAALFTEPWIYLFEAKAEVAICAYWLGRKQEALEHFEALLPDVPVEQRRWAEGQIALCRREIAR